MNFLREIEPYVQQDIENKMVFIGGARQVGKTTLAKALISKPNQYLSWDDIHDREIIRKHLIDPALERVVLDEIHKYSRWRGLLKGLYDKYGHELSIIVTGSARLDHLRRGGDSLVGRYHYYRLHPLSLGELDKHYKRESTEALLNFSGFPEPLSHGQARFHRRWQRERIHRVVYQDLRDLDTVKDLSKMELLTDLLPSRVGSLLSIRSLHEDLEVSPNSVSHWIEVLESVYYCYRILPYGSPKIRAIKKTPKLYLWDWSEVQNKGARFENMIAGQLLKFCHFIEDTQGYKMELRYLRDTDLRELDFIVLKDRKALFAVECKTGESSISKHIKYFRQRSPIPQFYQVHLGKKDYQDKNIRVLSFESFSRILDSIKESYVGENN